MTKSLTNPIACPCWDMHPFHTTGDHRAHHDIYERGVRRPVWFCPGVEEGVHFVDHTSAPHEYGIATKLLRAACHEMGWLWGWADPQPIRDDRDDLHRAALVFDAVRVHGYASWYLSAERYFVDFESRTFTAPERGGSWVSIDSVWVARSRRGQGAAKRLIRALCDRTGVELQELGWSGPFEDVEQAFFRSLGLRQVWRGA